jgi:hypothetical protein
MKRLLSTFLVLFIAISLVGCDSKESFKKSSFSADKQKAIQNSIEFIRNSSFTQKYRINTNIIKIENVTENDWESVWYENSSVEKSAIDLTDWIIIIGNTSGHDFAVIVCDSSTYKVIGYMPIK